MKYIRKRKRIDMKSKREKEKSAGKTISAKFITWKDRGNERMN